MGARERALAYSKTHPYRKGVELGYPYLRRRGRELSSRGVQFFDLTEIFEENEEPLYADHCCHFNERGIQIFARAID